jgi:hypothetical protein
MAFNFMSFLGGAAEQLTEVIETREAERMYEERQVKAEQREESRFAKRQAASAARDRKKSEKEAADLAGALSMFYKPDRVTEIMSGGMAKAKWHLDMGGKLAEKGLSGDTMYASPAAPKPTVDVGAAAPAVAPAPSLTAEEREKFTQEVAEQAEAASLPIPSNIPAKQSSINFGFLAKTFAPADEEQATLDAAYAVAYQKSVNATDPKEQTKYAAEAEKYLNAIHEKDKKLKADGEESDAFSSTTINSNINGFYTRALNDFGIEANLKDGVLQSLAGKLPENQTAIIQANMQVQMLNRKDGKVVSPDAETLFRSNVSGSVRKLQAYGMRQANGLDIAEESNTTGSSITDRRVNTMADPVPISQLQKNTFNYKVGDVLFVQEEDGSTSVRVFTGVKITPVHDMFVNAGKVNG